MSSKEKDKQKMQYGQPSQPSQPRILPATMMPVKQESSSQVVPFPGYSPIPVNNMFNPLSQPSLRPNYQSTLVSNYDPFIVNPPALVPSQSQSPVKRSNYAARSHTHLFVVESYLEEFCDPVKIAKKFFPPNLHYFPIKWWDKFGVDRIIYQVNAEFPPLQAPVNPVKDASPNSSNASLEGKSKKELTKLAEQILAQVTQMKDEDSDDASPKFESSSSQQPCQPFSQKPKPRWSDYAPDSQDPHDLNED
ncbi:hypothetical protein ACE6H2_015510 [Prunus campanulata]